MKRVVQVIRMGRTDASGIWLINDIRAPGGVSDASSRDFCVIVNLYPRNAYTLSYHSYMGFGLRNKLSRGVSRILSEHCTLGPKSSFLIWGITMYSDHFSRSYSPLTVLISVYSSSRDYKHAVDSTGKLGHAGG